MTIRLRPCNRCRSATEMRRLGPISGDTKGITVEVSGMPVLVCSNGHRQFVDSAFPVRLLEHLLDKDDREVPAGKKKGTLFKHFLCTQCGSELARTPDHDHTFTLDVALKGLDPFRVHLTMPLYRCTDCAKEQVHSREEVQRHAPVALGHAFQRGEILHD